MTKFWPRLIVGEPEVSTRKMHVDPIVVTDLEDDHKAVVEKMMYDQRQKELGLPSSDEQKKIRIAEKLKRINPSLNIDPSQISMAGDDNSGFSFKSHS